MDYAKFVNVFQGCDAIDLPDPKGVAKYWRFIKGLCGNCTPAAALPFGKVTACCYSSAYSSGYGRLMKNSHGAIRTLSEHDQFKGISHLQNDGVGDIEIFYNYAVISPYTNDLKHAADLRDFTNERAYPGYYACTDTLTSADCEVVVTPRCALHRITFPGENGRISIDFSNDGLYEDGQHNRKPAGEAHLQILENNEVAVCAVLHDLPICFHVKISGVQDRIRLWLDDAETDCNVLDAPVGHRFGICFAAQQEVGIMLALSSKSAEIAENDVRNTSLSFDDARTAATEAWNTALSRLQVVFDDPQDNEIFYSNLYHTLLKPSDWSGESFLYQNEAFVVDFATIWDQYKTQLPLIFSLYPEMSGKIVSTILSTAESTQHMPHTLMLSGDSKTICSTQARMLAEHALADAWLRGVPFDIRKAVELSYADTFQWGHFDDMVIQADEDASKSFIIDITDACAACAMMARSAGMTEAAEHFEAVAARWRNAFDEQDGLLRNTGRFYEGTRWNYSFRLMHDMKNRMALAGGQTGMAALADRFFGYSHPEDESACCFEGFNNETDMETPYIYHFAGRHDRLAEVIRDGMDSMFTTGRGGLPGNNDSGGLTSCYIWNTIGIFPVSGQDLMIIGSPKPVRTVMQLANGRTFTIQRHGKGIYVHKAMLNSIEKPDLCFTVRDMMEGGTLDLTMSEEP